MVESYQGVGRNPLKAGQVIPTKWHSPQGSLGVSSSQSPKSGSSHSNVKKSRIFWKVVEKCRNPLKAGQVIPTRQQIYGIYYTETESQAPKSGSSHSNEKMKKMEKEKGMESQSPKSGSSHSNRASQSRFQFSN